MSELRSSESLEEIRHLFSEKDGVGDMNDLLLRLKSKEVFY